ncbi:MAG TPA: hypothetical protein VGI79_17750, partial [Caulobacteraceae bacterium]
MEQNAHEASAAADAQAEREQRNFRGVVFSIALSVVAVFASFIAIQVTHIDANKALIAANENASDALSGAHADSAAAIGKADIDAKAALDSANAAVRKTLERADAANAISRGSLILGERAFVYLDHVEIIPTLDEAGNQITDWRVEPFLQNGGSTPTRALRTYSVLEQKASGPTLEGAQSINPFPCHITDKHTYFMDFAFPTG